ncbi:MAG: molybdopterin molybdotransferase MoeA [Gammaproteobacteria bacterium]|nr:molybdopterin molybdotransferase MoeA [Gammaproteobacteria bacterium]
MDKQPSCADEYDPSSLDADLALQRILDRIRPLEGHVRLFLRESLGRVLDQDVLSPINVPAYTNSAMDGYAIRSQDLQGNDGTSLKVVGKAFAGHPFEGAIGSGECIRIMTGAPVPSGADSVVMQEHAQVNGDFINVSDVLRAGENVRHAGEDLSMGQPALLSGTLLRPADIGLLASLGIAEVRVKRKVRVAFFSTGDELKSIGEPLDKGQIYDSNRYTLFGMLYRLGVEMIDMGIIPDNKAEIRSAYEIASKNADAVITSGGVSVGEADFVKMLLEEMGDVHFWKIAMKPGKPLTFGQLQGSYFFGLPGNPVSAMVTFYQFVKPGLLKLMGIPPSPPLTIKVRSSENLKKRPGRKDYQRGILFQTAQGEWQVKSTGNQGSHILNSMSLANCFIVLPLESGGIKAGEWVDIQPFEGLV